MSGCKDAGRRAHLLRRQIRRQDLGEDDVVRKRLELPLVSGWSQATYEFASLDRQGAKVDTRGELDDDAIIAKLRCANDILSSKP